MTRIAGVVLGAEHDPARIASERRGGDLVAGEQGVRVGLTRRQAGASTATSCPMVSARSSGRENIGQWPVGRST